MDSLLPPAERTAADRREWWRRAPAVAGPVALRGSRTVGRSLPFAATVAFTACLLLAPQYHFPALGVLHLAAVTGALAIAGQLWRQLERREPLFTCIEDRLAAALVLWAFATIPSSYWPGGSVAQLTGVYLKSLAIFWVLCRAIDTRERLRKFAWTLTLLMVPLAVTALINLSAGTFLAGASRPELQRIVGYDAPLTANPNDLALMINLVLPLSVELFLIERRRLVRLLLACAVGLDVLAVVATFSRAGALTLATILAGFVWMLRRRPERGWTWAAVAIGLFCFSMLPGGYLERLRTVTDIASDPTGSAQARWRDEVAAAGVVMSHPVFGTGLGMNYLALNEARGATWSSVHNAYLQYAADLGLPGLALFLWLLWSCLRAVAGIRRRLPPDDDLARLAQALQLGLIGFSVACFFHPIAYNFYFFYLAGLSVAARRIEALEANQGEPRAAAAPRPWFKAPSPSREEER